MSNNNPSIRKTLALLVLFIPLCYFHVVPAPFLFANSIKTIDADLLEKELFNSGSKVAIVDFWSTWCSPCQKQVHVLTKLFEIYKPNELLIIGISLDYSKKKVEKFVNKHVVKYPVYLGDEDLAFSYKINALPTTLIYDKDGNMVKDHIGFINESELKGIIEDILDIK